MREGMSPGLLVSQDFRTVNRHFLSACENGLRPQMPMSAYCLDIVKQAHASEDLAVKKMLFLTVLCILPEVRAYYASRCPRRKFDTWFATLRESLDAFLVSKHRDGSSKCASVRDVRYRSVAAFVGAMTANYVGC